MSRTGSTAPPVPRTVRPVRFGVPAAAAYDLLVDPRRRPEWQASLRRVDAVRPAPGGSVVAPGTTWTDTTVVPGIAPRMGLSVSERPTHWVEEGRFGPFTAWLRLDFLASRSGCHVVARVLVRGPLGLGRVLTRLAAPAVRADLARAAHLLGPRDPAGRS